MSYAPKDCQPTIVDHEGEFQKELEKLAERLGKEINDLTEDEVDDVRKTFMASHGLCESDFMIP